MSVQPGLHICLSFRHSRASVHLYVVVGGVIKDQASVSLNFARQRISYELSCANRTYKKCFTNVTFVRIVVRSSPICSQMCDRVEAVADSANFAELTKCHGGNVQFVSIQTTKSRFIELSGFSEVRNHVLSYFFSACDMTSVKKPLYLWQNTSILD